MRSILEKALVALLNEEKSKADALFHEFILERSRQIHESLRQGEDFVLDESWENEMSVDEMFTEADFGDEEVTEDEESDIDTDIDSEEETEDETSDEEESEEASDEETTGEAGSEEVAGEEEGTIEDRVADLESELQRLTAEFDGAFGADEDTGEEVIALDAPAFGGEEVVATDVPADMPAAFGGEEVDAEDFESLGESALSDLETVVVPKNPEGKFLQDGKVAVNTKSPIVSKPVEQRQAGEPVKIKAEEHSGYEREAAPKTAGMTKRQNTLAKADAKQTGVSKEGDKSALINTGKEDKSNQHSLFDKKFK